MLQATRYNSNIGNFQTASGAPAVRPVPRIPRHVQPAQATAAAFGPHIDSIGHVASVPCHSSCSRASRSTSSRGRIITQDSSATQTSSAPVSTISSNVPRAASRPHQQSTDSNAQQQQVQQLQQQQDQEIKGLKQLVLQQQALITTLQRDMQELKGILLQPPNSSSSSSSSPQGPGSWRQSLQHTPLQQGEITIPIITPVTQQQQQQQQPLEHLPAYQPMSMETFQSLPDKIILVRHAESMGNVDATTYSNTPDYEVPLSARGWEQAVACGNSLRSMMEAEHGTNYKLFFMTSPYCRTRQTFVGIRQAFPDDNFAGVQEEVQLREQDFGNFQNPTKIQADLAERNRFGRFYYRFPDGESGSDVYNRVSIFEDHLIRDMKASRFSATTSLCMVTHGLTMRVFLMRWFNWTVESFLQVYNPPNATPIIVDKISEAEYLQQVTKLRDRRQSLQVKHAYRLRNDSKRALKMNTVATTDHIDLVNHNYMH